MPPNMNIYHLSEPSSSPIIQAALTTLRPHFPRCLPLYRRLQFGRFYETSHVLTNLNLSTDPHKPNNAPTELFILAFVDRAVRPETEVWLFGSFESPYSSPPTLTQYTHQLCLDFVRTLSSLPVPVSIHSSPAPTSDPTDESTNRFSSHTSDPRMILFGAVGEGMRDALHAAGVLDHDGVRDEPNHVFIWDVEKFQEYSEDLDEGLKWGRVKREDLRIVRSRTQIPRQEGTLAGLPSLGVYDGTGRIVAWAFVGLDASLTTLHVEEEFRGRGLAKKMTAKLFREEMGRFWEEGMPRIAHGNVMYGNQASVAMCKSLGGVDVGKCYWLRERLCTG